MVKNNQKLQIKICPCCGNDKFTQQDILWDELVSEWNLSKFEKNYINRQQGLQCNNCSTNLRSMTLAHAIMRHYNFIGYLKDFVKKNKRTLKVLEVNEAGMLNKYFDNMKRHILVEYPNVKIESLPFDDDLFDLVIHSDTLEHVKSPLKGLTDTFRILKPGGATIFTTPIIVDRISKSRIGLKKSYHGSPGNDEYLVMNEFGADIWKEVMSAGFSECRLVSLDYPASIAIVGVK